MDRLKEIRQRCEAATPGPWDSKTNRHPECNGEPWGWISGASGNITWSGSAGKANADFIAHSRDDMEYLLSEVTELTELLNASKAGQLTLQKAWEQDKDELTARAEAAEADLRKCAPCWLCKKKCGIFDALDQRKDGCCPNFEWRGQQAEKGVEHE